jgi:hypothetical protein
MKKKHVEVLRFAVYNSHLKRTDNIIENPFDLDIVSNINNSKNKIMRRTNTVLG